MNELILVSPGPEHQAQAMEYRQELSPNGENISGGGGLNRFDDYGNWLKQLELDEFHYQDVPRTTYFVVRQSDNRIVGMLNLRHRLDDILLKDRGSIGYSVRPDERRKGYGSEILKLAIAKCRELGIDRVLLVCDKDNTASIKTIIKNGGVLENEITDSEFGSVMQRYWIKIR